MFLSNAGPSRPAGPRGGDPGKEIPHRIPSPRDDVYVSLMENQTGETLESPTVDNFADLLRGRVDDIYLSESRRVFATLIRRLGDFDLLLIDPSPVIELNRAVAVAMRDGPISADDLGNQRQRGLPTSAPSA
jgi:hypothetical protein